MNRCRMTLRILVTLFAVLALVGSVAMAKTPTGPDLPKTMKGTAGNANSPIIKETGTGGTVIIGNEEVRYQGDAAKSSEAHPGENTSKYLPASSFLSDGFETAVPPAGWSEFITNSGFNWKQQTLSFHSGAACADVEYDPALVPQDEWIITPAMNFSSATANLKVEFWWMMSYYWGVSPFDNYDYELWISTDGGATWPTKLWDESGEGVFTNFTWYQETVDLSGYVGQTNVKLRWRYTGVDGAQAGLDDVSVNDNAAPIGRCCYGAGSCADVTAAACGTLGGTWDGALNCTANPCPVPGIGDNCGNPIKVSLPGALPYADLNQYTCGRVDDYNATCMGSYDGGEDIVYEVTVTAPVNVNITLDPTGETYAGFAIDNAASCPLDAATGSCVAFASSSGSAAFGVINVALTPGVYYLVVDTWPSPTCLVNFNLSIIETPPLPPGANCGDPYVITVGAGDLPFTATGLTTCGMINDYSNTCMGSYDGGEDAIFQLNLTEPLLIDLTLNPNGTTYAGMAIDNVCPLDIATGSCLGYIGTSSGSAKSIYGLNLAAGTYYIMVDTWPSPNCIPNFSLSIAGAAPPPANDLCANATATGDVVNLPFTTLGASFDGGGTCQTAPNVWYCYTAPITGAARISLCGSGYDTKMAVYDGCTCGPLGAQLACNDDFCSLQSEVTIPVVAGNQYRIEVGGYSANVGAGVLTIESFIPPPNDLCTAVTPVTLTTGVPVTFNGDNTNATSAGDCSGFVDYGNVWEAFTLTECSDVTLDYCGTTPAFGNAWLNLAIGCPCTGFTPGGAFDVSTCGDGNVTINWSALAPGTYYYPVMNDPANGAVGEYTINVVANAVVDYCAADGLCDEYISRVQLGSIDNASSCGASYEDYTSISTGLVQTVPYTLTVTNGSPYTSDQCGVWIDWNGNKCFEATEQIIMSGGPASYTATVTAPLSATVGPTRMRVRIMYTGTLSACGTASYGEVEDYTVNVIELAPAAVITPHPQYMYYKFAVTPIVNTFYFGMFDGGYTAADVNLSTITVNGIPVASSGVVASYPNFAGPVVAATLPLTTFLDPYGLLYDVNNLTFTVAWDYNDATSESITDDVTIIGKSSPVPGRYIVPPGNFVYVPGDFDLSGQITISDPVAIIAYIFAGGTAPSNAMIGDADCSRLVTISDAVYMINYIFAGGGAPCTANQ